jgi:VanZ family protein
MAMTARPLRYLTLWRTFGRLLVVAMLAVALLPAPAVVGAVPLGDKIGHVCAFAFLMLWYAQIYDGGERARCALAALGLGILIELLQALTPYRSAEFADLAADAIGVGLGWLVARGPLGNLLSWLEDRATVSARR